MQKILIQLDTDELPSSFDRVVAVDAGVEQLFSYGGVTPENVESLVHGGMFTRGPADLKNTAIFIGGSNVVAGEELLAKVKKTMFPPMTVSVMMDSNGSNTTAAAAVLCAARHVTLAETSAIVLGGTGPVGLRAAELLAGAGADVKLCSRGLSRAEQACEQIRQRHSDAQLTAVEAGDSDAILSAAADRSLLIAAGAAGVEFLNESQLGSLSNLQVAIDLNAVPPTGLGGISVTDKAKEIGDVICYGAIGVGGLKMKIHRACVQALFSSNDRIMETQAIYDLGRNL